MATVYPHIISCDESRLSDWVLLKSKEVVRSPEKAPEKYHSFAQADYVSVFAMTSDGRIPLVRQYRPALERYTLELPGGLRDKDEAPEVCALRELYEETGFQAIGMPIDLGRFAPDTGRLENNLWGFAVKTTEEVNAAWNSESGVETIIASRAQLHKWLINGEFNHALHIALIAMAQLRGFFKWDLADE